MARCKRRQQVRFFLRPRVTYSNFRYRLQLRLAWHPFAPSFTASSDRQLALAQRNKEALFIIIIEGR